MTLALSDLKEKFKSRRLFAQCAKYLPGELLDEMMCPIVLLSFLLVVLNKYSCSGNKIFHTPLDSENINTLNWALDYNKKVVIFEVHIEPINGWFAIGFSNRGEQFPADYCLLYQNMKKHTYLKDVWADEAGVVQVDHQQDCENFRITTTKGVTKFTFKRKFDTCDDEDYIIQDGTTHIVWSRGNQLLYKVEGLNISSPNGDHGMVRVQILNNIHVPESVQSQTIPMDFLADKVKVPAVETMYWCHVFQLPKSLEEKHHVYEYESQIKNEGLVHHMELFHCETDLTKGFPLYVGPCQAPNRPQATQVCKRVLAAWAMGAPPLTYPEVAGLPIGGEKFAPYVMLEVHYNNPEKKSDFIDSSGIRLYVSKKLRQMDVGVIELGLEYTDKMAIPPGQESFPLTGYCVSECTAVGLPPEGITVFASQLHTHLTGIRVHTRHIRNGREMNELNRDDHYSTHFQEIRSLKKPVHVLPGDALITTCDYGTEDRPNVTLGGFAISDEMCVNYIHYYPATALEVCKSAISDQALTTYFRYMNEWESQPTSPNKGVSDNYKSIAWNKMRVQLLRDIYSEAPLSMQCNMSSGDRFPGYWENTPVTQILLPLAPPPRECDSIATY